MSRQIRIRSSVLWNPVYADVISGEYDLVTDDTVSILETAFQLIPTVGPHEALLTAFERAGWLEFLERISGAVVRHSSSNLAELVSRFAVPRSDRSAALQELQAMASRAIEIAESWMCSFLCPEHLFLSLMEGVARTATNLHSLVSEVRAEIVVVFYQSIDPEVAAREYLSLMLLARDGDETALDRLVQMLPTTLPDVDIAHVKTGLRTAVRNFRGGNPRDAHNVVVQVLLQRD